MQLLIRFVVGGLVVSSFAMLADVLRPKVRRMRGGRRSADCKKPSIGR